MDRNSFYDNLANYSKNSLQNENKYAYDTLVHSVVGSRKENSKYYKREGEPGHYKYYYTQEQYNKDKNKQHNNKYSEERQKEKSDHAKNKQMFDKKFVDIIKNNDNMTKEERLEEYAKYLQDPDNYTEEEYKRNRNIK